MSGKHVKQVAWRPRRLAPLLTLLAGFGTWVALAAALVLLPATSPAEVQGTLGGSAQDGGDREERGGPSVVPPQTLSTGPTTPADATPSDERTAGSRTAEPDAGATTTAGPVSDATVDPTSDPTTAEPGPAPTSPPGQANGHDDDNPGKGHGPHGKP